MQPLRSRFRYKFPLLLVLAGAGMSAGVLWYQTASAQEQDPGFDEQPIEGVEEHDAVPLPEVLPELPVEEEMSDPAQDANRDEVPTTATTTAPAPALDEPAEPTRRGDRLRGTRVDGRRRESSTTQPTSRPVIATATTRPSHDSTATTRPGVVLTKTNGHGILLNFQDASTDAVLEELSSAAGFIVVKEVASVSGRVTLMSKQPVTPDEAVSLLNTVLKKNGYTAVRQGRVLKVMEVNKARKSAIPVRSGRDPEKIEPTDEMITQVIPISNADATQLKEDLAPLINTETADFSANASSNSLILTDTAANIRRVVEVVSALDTGMANSTDFKAFKLKYASAANAAKLIMEIFGQQQQTSSNQSGGSGFPSFFGGFSGFRRDGERDRGSDRGSSRSSSSPNSTEARKAGRVTASSDDRTNTVVVTAPTDLLEDIGKIITQLDSDPTEEQAVFVHSLRNAQSAQLEAVINSLFNGGGSVGSSASRNQNRSSSLSGNSSVFGGSSRSGSSGFGGGGRSSFGSGNSGGFGSGGFGNSGGFGSGGFGSSGFGSTSGRSYGGSNVSSGTARAASELAGQVTVVADQDTNSLLVMTAPTNFERVKRIIEELDRPVPQVLIKVLIAEVTHDNSLDVGAEFSILNLRASGLGQTVGTDFGLSAATGGLVARVLESDVTATLRALERRGKLDVLSRPYILGSDNQLASISVGQEVPIPQSTRVDDNGGIYSSVEYEPVGILLSVIPHINPDGLVIMDVQPTISALTDSSIQINEDFNAPVFNSRTAQSRVAIQNGKTIVIGGLMEDRKNEALRKIPILGDLPIIGAAFRRLERTKSKTELLIFLTPHVASAPEMLPGMTEDELGGTKLVPKAVDPGEYEEHRKGLDRGATTVTPRGGAHDLSPTTKPMDDPAEGPILPRK